MSQQCEADRTLAVAVAQFTSGSDVGANLSRVAELTAEAAGRGAELVVFPEAAMFDWKASADDVALAAEEHAQEFSAELARTAKAHAVAIVAGTFAPAGPGRHPFNRMVAVDSSGAQIGSYDKVHLYDAFSWRESDKVTAGPTDESASELCTIGVGPFTFGLLNCYDLRFPEIARLLIDAGADALIVSSAWVSGPHKEMHWETLLRARAIENTCYVLGSNQSPPASVGLSMIVDPFGLVAATSTGADGVAVHRLSARHLAECREIVPSLRHRRYRVVPGTPARA